MRTSVLLFFGLVLVLGCEGSAKVAAVSGIVTLNGKPLPNAAVSFQPIGETLNPGPGSTGLTNDRGEYTLQVTGGGKGAMVGRHRVEISCLEAEGKNKPQEDPRTKPRERVPLEYNLRSKLTFEVKPGKNTANFDLTS
jgi:hypothetical protein